MNTHRKKTPTQETQVITDLPQAIVHRLPILHDAEGQHVIHPLTGKRVSLTTHGHATPMLCMNAKEKNKTPETKMQVGCYERHVVPIETDADGTRWVTNPATGTRMPLNEAPSLLPLDQRVVSDHPHSVE